jgi:pimeloyl-ACP methyl ester carboxylesterase
MSIVVLQEENVHYEVLGRGKPLLFLHGWVGSWRYWVPAMQSTCVSFRTYALDLWGFGDTTKEVSFYSLEQQVLLLSMFIKEIGIGRVALIGHGLGAIVAALYAEQNSKLVDRILAVSLPENNQILNTRMATAPPAELVDWLLNRSVHSEPVRTEAPKADLRSIQLSLANLERVDLAALIQNIKPPCLLVYGQNDPAVNAPLLQEQSPLAKNFVALPENVHQIVFDNSGHFPMIDESNKFNRLLKDFLSLCSGVSPRQLQLKDEWKRRIR